MRSLAIVVLLALPLTGSALAPMAPDRPAEAPLEATTAAAVPAQRQEAPCVPLLAAERGAPRYIALSWTECTGAERYLVLSGPSAAELAPLVEVNHPSHIDLAPAWATAVYAVSTLGGPLSEPVVVPLSS